MCSSDIFLGLLALLFPPLAVWVKRGICSADSLINILLCCLGYIPGLIHAWYIIVKFPEPDYEYTVLDQDAEGSGRVTYVIVHPADRRQQGHRSQQPASSARQQQQPQRQDNMNYGATSNAAAAPAPANGPAPAQAPAGGNAGEGRSDAPPPSYAQVVAGDNKVQSHD